MNKYNLRDMLIGSKKSAQQPLFTEDAPRTAGGDTRATETTLNQDETHSTLLLLEKRETIKQRRIWSNTLLALIVVIIVVDLAIVIAAGLKWVHYDGFTLPAFIASNLAQVFALSYIVVKYLFQPKK